MSLTIFPAIILEDIMKRLLASIAAAAVATTGLVGCGDDHREERLKQAGANPDFTALMKVADADVGRRKFRQCASCHSIIQGASDRGGPNLYGVFGTRFGTNRSRFGYTSALSSAAGVWDAHTLNVWMQNPIKLVPGTTMQIAGVEDPLTRADIIAYLESQTQ